MNIHIPYNSDQNIGGGYTFFRNFASAISHNPNLTLVNETMPHEVLFAFSPSTISGEVIARSKAKGAKFVLRMDGVPEDNRNSGKGTRRLVEYALKADFIIFQSNFVQQTVGRILRDNGVVCPTVIIQNGVDTSIFTSAGGKVNLQGSPKILHVAYRKDNNKRYEEVLQMYRELWTYNKQANLILIGRYPTEWQDYNMGFFNGERYKRMGIMTDDTAKATFMRSCDVMFYPAYADPAPNVVLEAMACGVPIVYNRYGGVAEYVGDCGVAIGSGGSYPELIERAMQIDRSIVRGKALQYSLEEMMRKYIWAFENV